jgi:hypothetical protein
MPDSHEQVPTLEELKAKLRMLRIDDPWSACR